MGHWARIDENNIVQEVIVIKETELDTGNWGNKANWIKTSYNTHNGKHYVPKEHQDWSEESADQSKALRYRFAGKGYFYNRDNDVFMPSIKPYPSWVVNNTSWIWEAPIVCPTLTQEQIDAENYYTWDEDAYQADNTQGWVLNE